MAITPCMIGIGMFLALRRRSSSCLPIDPDLVVFVVAVSSVSPLIISLVVSFFFFLSFLLASISIILLLLRKLID